LPYAAEVNGATLKSSRRIGPRNEGKGRAQKAESKGEGQHSVAIEPTFRIEAK